MGRLVKLHIKDYVDQVYSNDDGVVIYQILKNELENSNKVSVSFQDIKALNSSFINSAFVELLNDYDFQFIKENLSFVDSTKAINNTIKSRFSFEIDERKQYV
ncbi:hypothetical protein GCM10007216_30700 [Thalassobacillus devorans]|uniref:DUF4325 domain-containing protein n=1 Tax=Thalassobacillus devorans TaxID=279813 RepID=A0ABQ1PII2_9BACI|nr:STAS-like domain-containing protein [Thalassobacillus devorans]NIK30030.1 hypothetical protein [Thalassobacillus devorans]GGC97774.1 hypothetical protein GCM10007216_30700 [Thalassobacillus devorans]